MKTVFVAGYPGTCENYIRALRECGVEVRLTLNEKEAEKCDGLLLPGGGDMDPSFFDQKNTGSNPPDLWLDKKQLDIMNAFVKEKKPVFGICRGMQLINVYFGGDLIQHLETADQHLSTEEGCPDLFHEIISIATPWYGTHFMVNSAHHQGIGEFGKGILPTMYALDGVIEGIRHCTLPITGVQWHPERLHFPAANGVTSSLSTHEKATP